MQSSYHTIRHITTFGAHTLVHCTAAPAWIGLSRTSFASFGGVTRPPAKDLTNLVTKGRSSIDHTPPRDSRKEWVTVRWRKEGVPWVRQARTRSPPSNSHDPRSLPWTSSWCLAHPLRSGTAPWDRETVRAHPRILWPGSELPARWTLSTISPSPVPTRKKKEARKHTKQRRLHNCSPEETRVHKQIAALHRKAGEWT